MPLVGTPEQIVDGMLAMSKVGLDGCTLSWVDYDLGITSTRSRSILCLSKRACARRNRRPP